MLTPFAKNEINSILKDDLKNEGVKNTFPKPDIDFANKDLEIKGLTESYTIVEIVENDSVFVVFGNTLISISVDTVCFAASSSASASCSAVVTL